MLNMTKPCFICDKHKSNYINYKYSKEEWGEKYELLICSSCMYLPVPCCSRYTCCYNFISATNKVHGKYYCLSCYKSKIYKYIDLYMSTSPNLTPFIKKYI